MPNDQNFSIDLAVGTYDDNLYVVEVVSLLLIIVDTSFDICSFTFGILSRNTHINFLSQVERQV